MIEEKTKVTHAARYELIDKDGISFGCYQTAIAAADAAKWIWPDQEQDEDRTGAGWDIQVAGVD